MAKNFKNLNSKEKYKFLFDTYKRCDCCHGTKTNNCFFDRENNKLLKTCKTCRNKLKRKHQEEEIMYILLDAIDKGALKL